MSVTGPNVYFCTNKCLRQNELTKLLCTAIFFHPNPVAEQENQEKSYEKCWQASSISMNEWMNYYSLPKSKIF